MISLVIPFIDQHEFLDRCLDNIRRFTTAEIEIVLINNGGKSYKPKHDVPSNRNHTMVLVDNLTNIGVLKTFQQGLEVSSGDIICFIHSDVLIHESGWNERVEFAFAADPGLGLAGLIGARGCFPDGGREGTMSNMSGEVWGGCECHDVVARHHGELMMGTAPAATLDGVGMFFRRTALEEVAKKTNIFAEDRPPHHWYDRNICMNFLEQGWRIKVLGIKFDHWSGATANQSPEYHDYAKEWCEKRNIPLEDGNSDLTVYKVGEKQFFEEWSPKLPVTVDDNFTVTWSR